MGNTIFYSILFVTGILLVAAYEEAEIHGYHFHTYFFQDNAQNSEEALSFR
jgi:hypothetical protein